MSEDISRKFYDRVTEMCERLAKIETLLTVQEDTSKRLGTLIDSHEKRICGLEERNARFFSVREFIAWAVAVSIGIAGVVLR